MSNTQSFRYSLVKAGFSPDQILCISREDPFYDSRNLQNDKIHLNDKISLDHSLISLEKLTDKYLLNLLYLRHNFLFQIDENDNVLIYICGHAASEFFKICDKYYMFSNDIMSAITYLSTRIKFGVIILDTCQASSLISPSEIPSNICIVTTSSSTEFSYSSVYVPSLGISSIDDFSYSIYTHGLHLQTTIEECFGLVSKNMSSTVTCWGSSNITLRDFLFSHENDKIERFKID